MDGAQVDGDNPKSEVMSDPPHITVNEDENGKEDDNSSPSLSLTSSKTAVITGTAKPLLDAELSTMIGLLRKQMSNARFYSDTSPMVLSPFFPLSFFPSFLVYYVDRIGRQLWEN
jgi:hypothetical protein